MLRRTFLHLPGIGEATERRLWRKGISCWEDLRSHAAREDQLAALDHSMGAYARGDWRYFDQRLPSAHAWRAIDDLGAQAAYVDIETDGGMGAGSLTVIGVYDGRGVRHFVAEENLDEAREHLERFPLVVTYNGALFDLPIVRQRFPYNVFNWIHIDLRYPLHRLGYKGGLKRVEQQAGIERAARTRGLDGWDAVRLWREWMRGDAGARELLLEYNAEDVRNLKPLLELVRTEMHRRLSEAS